LKRSGKTVQTDMLLKCVGWLLPNLKGIFPDFAQRQFIFCNGKASIVFVCDPHYQVDSHDYGAVLTDEIRESNERKRKVMMQAAPEGGTFSVLVLARCAAILQLYFLTKPAAFRAALKTIPTSTSPMCSWFEQRWKYDGLTELNSLISVILNSGKKKLLDTFDLKGFMAMASAKLLRDMRATRKPEAVVKYPFKVVTDEEGNESVVLNETADGEEEDTVGSLRRTSQRLPSQLRNRSRAGRGLSSHTSNKWVSTRNIARGNTQRGSFAHR